MTHLLTKKFFNLLAVTALSLSAQSVLAAQSFAIAEYTGIQDIRTTGSATATVVSETAFSAITSSSDGVSDAANDGVSFSSATSSNIEATALNSGVASNTLAEALNTSDALAATIADLQLDVDGEGTIEVDFGFSLLVDALDNLDPSAFARAEIDIAGGLEGLVSQSLFITGNDVLGAGTLNTLEGVLTLTFDVFGPFSEFVAITTLAEANAVVPVPAAVWLMGSALVGLVGFRRK